MNQGELKAAVFEFLDSQNDLGNVTMKEMRIFVASKLNVVENELKGEVGEQMKQYTTEFSINQKIKNKKNVENNFQTGKFSKLESDLIMITINDFVRTNGVEISDICSHLRIEEEHKQKNFPIWKELYELFPHRTKKVVLINI
jgi:hypothetical protein